MKKSIIFIGLAVSCAVLPAFGQTGAGTAWETGEKNTFLGLTLFVRPNVMDIGGTVKGFFYDYQRPFMRVEEPVKTGRGRYRIQCVQGTEYTDEQVIIIFDIARSGETSALIQTVTLRSGGREQAASDFNNIMYVLMSFFRAE